MSTSGHETPREKRRFPNSATNCNCCTPNSYTIYAIDEPPAIANIGAIGQPLDKKTAPEH